MKNLCFIVIILCALLFDIKAQTTYVPDDNFEQYLISQGYDDVLDNYVLTANIEGLASIDISYRSISDLSGLEDFSSLRIFHCEHNSISSINTSGCPDLRQLYCNDNLLTTLDVSDNTALTLLVCYRNDLITLVTGSLPSLTSITCSDNNLTGLNLSGVPALSILHCYSNNITGLDLSNNTALTNLDCRNNNLVSLNVRNGNNGILTSFNAYNNPDLSCIEVDNATLANSGEMPYTYWVKEATATYADECVMERTWVPDDNFEQGLIDLGYDNTLDDYVTTYNISDLTTLDISSLGISDLTGIEDFAALTYLDCSYNILSTLDLSNNKLLISVYCNNNQLSSLNIRNENNNIIAAFDSRDNPALSCIMIDNEISALRDEAPYNNWFKDATSAYSADCSLLGVRVYVPDDRFEQALIDLDLDLIADDYVNASVAANIKTLSINSLLIQDLTGIEGFTSLENLECNNNQLENLDVSNNASLSVLECYSNNLQDLDLSNNTLLTQINCTNNQLNTLNVSSCTELTSLVCQNNNLQALDLSNNTLLGNLSARRNSIGSLDLSANSLLITLDCYDNQLTSLDVSNKTFLSYLDCGFNQISSLNLSGSSVNNLRCGDNNLVSLDVSDNNGLSQLDCHNNMLTALDLSNNPDLWFLDCRNNNLSSLDLSSNEQLVDFLCSNNQLTSLNIGNNSLIGAVYCSDNMIESLYTSGNPDLLTIVCNNNNISSLDLSTNLKLKRIVVSGNPLSDLTLPGGITGPKEETKADKAIPDLLSLNISSTDISSLIINEFNNLDSLQAQGSQLDSLDVSANIILRHLNSTNTPLECIKVNQDQLNNIPSGWIKETETEYSTDCKTTSVEETGMPEETVHIYPNPVYDFICIESAAHLIRAEIISLAGTRLMVIYKDFTYIPLKDLAKGTYIIRIETVSGIITKRITRR